MREVAEREHAHPRVRYVEGSAERIPLPDASCDAAFLSNVVHHVRDRDACAAQLRRVLRPGGLVLVRGTLRGSGRRVAFLNFFPTAREVAERHLPSLDEVVAMFASQGFEHVASELIEQETTPSLRAYYERVKLRAISTLERSATPNSRRGSPACGRRPSRSGLVSPSWSRSTSWSSAAPEAHAAFRPFRIMF